MSISTHVLDLARGTPGAGVEVRLDRKRDNDWEPVAGGHTDTDGRWRLDETLPPGIYRWVFQPGDDHFFPEIPIVFTVGLQAHLHVPLLLSAFGYSTYKGS